VRLQLLHRHAQPLGKKEHHPLRAVGICPNAAVPATRPQIATVNDGLQHNIVGGVVHHVGEILVQRQ
jgi:hypothetical protein